MKSKYIRFENIHTDRSSHLFEAQLVAATRSHILQPFSFERYQRTKIKRGGMPGQRQRGNTKIEPLKREGIKVATRHHCLKDSKKKAGKPSEGRNFASKTAVSPASPIIIP